MQTPETNVLMASQRDAQKVLAEAREKAERMLLDAHCEAVEMLLRQQDEAARLLLKQQDDLAVNSIRNMAEGKNLPPAEREALLKQHTQDTDQILEAQRVAAELLVAAQAEASRVLRESLQHAAADVLMTSHKEAAAILLQARLEVMDEWRGSETPEGHTPA